MRTQAQMTQLILDVAKKDERIRAVLLFGSRADSEVMPDKYQDYDITYFVDCAKPFYNNTIWINEQFDTPSIMQMPDLMPGIDAAKQPTDYSRFVYLMVFPDGNRIDLTVCEAPYVNTGEPCIVWLDKGNWLSNVSYNASHWHIKPPTQKQFSDCCNEFWWCLNNVAKGLARDELVYVMEMLNVHVRDMLSWMTAWYIGVDTEFSVAGGKGGKYFKKHLPSAVYERLLSTYCNASSRALWQAVYTMCELFRDMARHVAYNLQLEYNITEDIGLMQYINVVHDEQKRAT